MVVQGGKGGRGEEGGEEGLRGFIVRMYLRIGPIRKMQKFGLFVCCLWVPLLLVIAQVFIMRIWFNVPKLSGENIIGSMRQEQGAVFI